MDKENQNRKRNKMMKIFYEDEAVIVCIKPRGVLSQANSGGGESMITLLSDYTNTEIYPLHRLDREVGGVMVYAKTKQAAANISKQITERSFEKEYIALIHGEPIEKSGEMRDLLFKDSRKNKSYVVKRERKGVKLALLDYSVIDTNSNYSLVSIQLKTGRTHQIRVQFASRKMPLAGDKKYGANDEIKNIGLWSYKIAFNHPKTRERLVFEEQPDFCL